jgi:hypothetical protein
VTSRAGVHCGPVTVGCPASCLASVISLMALNRLLHASEAPQTAGDVVRLCQQGKLTNGNFSGLGPRRRSEIEAGLVLAGFDAVGRGPGDHPGQRGCSWCPVPARQAARVNASPARLAHISHSSLPDQLGKSRYAAVPAALAAATQKRCSVAMCMPCRGISAALAGRGSTGAVETWQPTRDGLPARGRPGSRPGRSPGLRRDARC